MSIRNSPKPTVVSRIGQRRQVVIPKAVFEALQLQEGDFVEMTVESGRLAMRPKRLVDVRDVLTKSEVAKVRTRRSPTESRAIPIMADGKT